MADFAKIVLWVMKQEDVLDKDKNLTGAVKTLPDGAGRTRLGIAEKDNPQLPSDFYTAPLAQAIEIAERVYKVKYWNPIWGDKITCDELAASLMSFAVNDGVVTGIKLLQIALNSLGAKGTAAGGGLEVDGVLGIFTLAAINMQDGPALAMRLRLAQLSHYRNIELQKPQDQQFADGWAKRANQVYPNLVL